MSRRYPIVVMDPYEPLNTARNITASSFRKILSALRATRDQLLDQTKPPSIRDLGLGVAHLESRGATKDVANNVVPTDKAKQKIAVEELKCTNSVTTKQHHSTWKLCRASHAETIVTSATTSAVEQEQESNLSLDEQNEHEDTARARPEAVQKQKTNVLEVRVGETELFGRARRKH